MAFIDNPASLAVNTGSYRRNGVVRRNRLGGLALNQQLALDPGDLVRGEPIEVVGLEPLRTSSASDNVAPSVWIRP